MGKFNLDDYEPVDVRIKAFYSDHPDGRITTELIPLGDILDSALFKASVWDSEILLATGHAFELKDDGYINKSCHIENCETSAIGRALANIGLSGNKRASREEMEKVERVTETDTEALPRKRQAINNMLDEHASYLLPEYIKAEKDNAESAKTVAEVQELGRKVKVEIKRVIARESKANTEDSFTETAAKVFKGEVVAGAKVPEVLQKEIDKNRAENDAGEGFKDDTAELGDAVKKDEPKQQDIF